MNGLEHNIPICSKGAVYQGATLQEPQSIQGHGIPGLSVSCTAHHAGSKVLICKSSFREDVWKPILAPEQMHGS